MKKKNKAFTLVELMVVLAIISIIIGIGYPNVVRYKKNLEEKELKHHIEVVEKGLRQYYALEGKFPEKLEELKKKEYGIFIDGENYEYEYKREDNTRNFNLNIQIK